MCIRDSSLPLSLCSSPPHCGGSAGVQGVLQPERGRAEPEAGGDGRGRQGSEPSLQGLRAVR
eukprot:1796400-Rhodomonas_salina.1